MVKNNTAIFLNAEFVFVSINISPPQWCWNDFLDREGAKNIKCSVSIVLRQNFQAFALTKMFNGSRVFAHSLFIKSQRGSGGGAPSVWGIYYQNNPF